MTKPRARRSRRPLPRRTRYADLADYFARSGDTQVHFAQHFDISQAHASRMATGQSVPRPDLAIRIAQYCDIPVGSFALAYCARRGLGGTAA